MRNTRLIPAFALGLALLSPAATHAQSSDSAAVLAAVQKLFVAMQTRDTAAARQLLVPGSQFVTMSLRDGTPRVRVVEDSSFLRSLG